MNHSAMDWLKHPGRDPRIPIVEEGRRGRRYFERSRWVPHVGAKQMAKEARKRLEATQRRP